MIKPIELNNLDGFMNGTLDDDPLLLLEEQVYALASKLNEVIGQLPPIKPLERK